MLIFLLMSARSDEGNVLNKKQWEFKIRLSAYFYSRGFFLLIPCERFEQFHLPQSFSPILAIIIPVERSFEIFKLSLHFSCVFELRVTL